VQLTNLRCEYLYDPLGIDVRQPRLSWEWQDLQRGVFQVAYQVLVASDPHLLAQDEGDLWDSGRVSSDETLGIAYAGQPLASRMRCYWKVRAWARVGQAGQAGQARLALQETPWSDAASWSMGLLEPADWRARWIGDPAPPPPDSPPHNGYRSLPAPTPNTPKWVSIDLGALCRFNGVRLYGARIFEAPPSDTPGYLFPLRFRIDVSSEPDFGECEIVVDHVHSDMINPGVQPVTYRFEPTVGRYVRLLVTRLRPDQYGTYGLALAEMEVLDGDSNLALGAEVTASDSWESAELGYDDLDVPASSTRPGSSKKAWSKSRLVDGDVYWHSGGPVQPLIPPVLRREFVLPGPVRRATLYATALGVYELHLNGQRVGDHILAPEWTDYRQCVQYQTYDVTALLRQGANAIGALLGDGHYAGRVGMTQSYGSMRLRAVYGRKPRLRAQLEVELADGRTHAIVTDGAWRSTTDGPIRTSDIYDGETQDARREMSGWDQPGYDDADWRATEVDGTIHVPMAAQMYPPIRIACALPFQAVHSPERGVYIFDLGQDITGWARLKVHGRAGQRITLRHAEALDADGRLYTAMLRGAVQTDHYTLRGDPQGEVFEPHFTYHGFRYVEVTGLDEPPSPADLSGQAFHSAMRETTLFECSSALANKLWQNILWTQRNVLQGTFLDCTQRDERLGWLGDPQAFAHTACFNMDLAAYLHKRFRDLRQAQAPDGRYYEIAPNVLDGPFPMGTAGWGDEGAIYPWVAYVHYGDKRLLEEQYGSACRWVDHTRSCSPGLISPFGTAGDWLNADTQEVEDSPRQGGAVPGQVYATAFFAYAARCVAHMAAALGLAEDAQRYKDLFEAVREAYNRAFVSADGRIEGDTQAGYALALHFDLLPPGLRPMAVAHMVEGVRRYGGRVSSGFQATHRMMLELSRGGQNPLAYALLHNRDCPSWGYMIDQGATTIWERWDAYVAGRQLRGKGMPSDPTWLQYPIAAGFQTSAMNSFNHAALGSVGEWMVRTILGIEPDEDQPGYKHFLVRPRPGPGVAWARGVYLSARGKIAVHWRTESAADGPVFYLDLRVPPNTTATAYLPTADRAALREGGFPLEQVAGARFLRMEDGAAVLAVQSGDYAFVSPIEAGFKSIG
jgi:alpha-L-rhamnosidase